MENWNEIHLSQFDRAYFIGIGGIGMSALARYFRALGWPVSGYDKTPSPLTHALEAEGIEVHYEDLGPSVPEFYRQKEKTLVVFTPAIPKNHGELLYFISQQAFLFKRSEVLGLLTKASKGLGVAGTHGKTTTSTLLAYILSGSPLKCNAFLGGISANFNSNLVIDKTSEYTVVEADEFDRSFLRLSPFASIITSTDPDHLDIYGSAANFREGFQQYASLIPENGLLVKKEGLELDSKAKVLTYAVNSNTADYEAKNLRYENGSFLMDVRTPDESMEDVELGIPGIHNAENALACIALTQFLGVSEADIRKGIQTFRGVHRRFEYHIKSQKLVYIDDYAHHPTEIHALIASVKLLYPDKKITGVFQPHLFTRTRDFFEGFAAELSQLDEVILLPVYPAREEPIPGITSDALLEKISAKEKKVLTPAQAIDYLSAIREGVILTIGAGDIDRIVEPLTEALKK